MRLACDLANYSTVPTPPQLQCLKDAGYTRAVVGCSYGTVADMQLAAFYAFGFDVEAYAWVSFGASWQTPIDHALLVIGHRPYVRKLWLDVEEEVTGMTSAQYEARIDAAIGYVNGKRPDLELGIYTGRWWWIKNLPACTKYTLPLFAAEYVTDPTSPPSGGPQLFGGWQSVELWQYAGSIDTCGLNLDRCVILEEHMPTPEYDELKQLIGNTLAYAVEARKALDAVATAFFDHVKASGGDTSAVQAEIDAINKRLDAAAAALKR